MGRLLSVRSRSEQRQRDYGEIQQVAPDEGATSSRQDKSHDEIDGECHPRDPGSPLAGCTEAGGCVRSQDWQRIRDEEDDGEKHQGPFGALFPRIASGLIDHGQRVPQ